MTEEIVGSKHWSTTGDRSAEVRVKGTSEGELVEEETEVRKYHSTLMTERG